MNYKGGWKNNLPKCMDCGKKVKSYYAKRCKKCMEMTQRGKNHPRWKGGEIKVKCKICGKIFDTKPSDLKTGRGKYCSPECYHESTKGKFVGINSPTYKNGKPHCINCGRIVHYGTKRCDKCSRKFKIKENSGNWRGGITPVNNKIRHSLEYNQWRESGFKRDEFTCAICNRKGGELHFHHVKPFVELLEETKQIFPLLSLYDAAMLYKPLWDINNGKTLCKKCHEDYHKQLRAIKKSEKFRGSMISRIKI